MPRPKLTQPAFGRYLGLILVMAFAIAGVCRLELGQSALAKPARAQPQGISQWQYPVNPYVPGSYAHRSFYCCSNPHLGEDEAQPAGTPVRPIGTGVIKVYRPAQGYGELVVVIEHDLGASYQFKNAKGATVSTRFILSIYGHLRKSEKRDGVETGLNVGETVDSNRIIGYVNDDEHNGDGAEHVHVGIRLSDAATAQAEDSKWFRGYEGAGKDNSGQGIHFAAASEVIATLISAQPFGGTLDEVKCDKIFGWAWNRTQPNTPVNVDIYDGGSKLGSATASEFRQDLVTHGIGDGRHAFNFPTPASLKDGQDHSIIVKVQNSTFQLNNSNLRFNSRCGGTPTAKITMIGGGKSGGNGEILDYVVQAGQKVKILFNGTASQLGGSLISAYKWTRSKVGFGNKGQIVVESVSTSTLPSFEEDLDAGTHNISLQVTDETGATDTKTATIVVNETASSVPQAVISMNSGGQTGGNGSTLNYSVAPGGSINMNFNAAGSQAGAGNSITAYEWRSNGTVISNLSTFTYPFAAASHTITLKVTNNAGLSHTATATIVVTQNTSTAPTAAIAMTSGGQSGGNGSTLNYTVSPGGSISMLFNGSGSQPGTGSITNYEWRSNGTVISNLSSFNYPFAAASHTITLKVTNSAGLSNTATATILVSQSNATAPKAVIFMSGAGQSGGNGSTLNYTVSAGGTVNMTFNGSSSTPGTGTITAREWRSNGTIINTGSTFSFAFGPATHVITLKVTNSSGVSDTATATIVVASSTTGPTSHFSMSAQGQTKTDGQTLTLSVPINGNVTVNFASTSSQGSSSITSYVWKSNGTQICTNSSTCNFNFGTASNAITLTVTDSNGLTSTASGQVNLTFPTGPTAHFSMSAQGQTKTDGQTLTLSVPVNGNVTVNFASTSTQGSSSIISYVWKSNGTQICTNSSTCNFNFGTASNAITLTVTDSNGLTSTASGQVNLTFPTGPTAHFSMSAQGQTKTDGQTLTLSVPVNGNVTVNFASTSTQGSSSITSYVWKSNGTQICTNSSTCNFNFGTASNAITLTVTDSNGLTSTASGQVNLTFPTGPTAHFSMSAQGQTKTDGQTLTLSVPVNGNVTVNFASTSSQGSSSITNYVWKSNGTQICSNSSTCNFNFGTAGNTITLTVTNGNGLSSTATGQVNLTFH